MGKTMNCLRHISGLRSGLVLSSTLEVAPPGWFPRPGMHQGPLRKMPAFDLQKKHVSMVQG